MPNVEELTVTVDTTSVEEPTVMKLTINENINVADNDSITVTLTTEE